MYYSTVLRLALLTLTSAIYVIGGPIAHRSTNTCADPNLADVFVEGWTKEGTSHVINERWVFVNAVTNGGDWQIQGEIFKGWKTQQENTVPLFALHNPTTSDFIFVTSPSVETTPVAAGFGSVGIIGFVYNTQICSSVPLYTLFQDVVNDHWYTTSASERDSLVQNGWIDSGIAAYVLPL